MDYNSIRLRIPKINSSRSRKKKTSFEHLDSLKVASENLTNQAIINNIGKDLVVLVILNHSRQSILLKNACLSELKDSDRFQYWFPYTNFSSNESTGQMIERTINEFEDEFCKNLIQIESESKSDQISKKCDSICLIRIYSTHLFPLYSLKNSNFPKSSFFLVILNKHSKLNHLNKQNPNEIHNDNLDEKLKWMDFNELKQAQQSFKLLGLEPLLFFKKFIIESNELNLMVENVFYEPSMTYFQCENQSNCTQQPNLIDLMVSSAKFHKNVQERLFNVYFECTYPSEYLSIVKFKNLFRKFVNFFLQQSDLNIDINNVLEKYFYAFDTNQKYMLNFSDFVMGLAAMEPSTQHGGPPAEQRCKYIFRYYSLNDLDKPKNCQSDSNFMLSMNFSQFRDLTKDITILKKGGIKLENEILETEALNGYKSFGLRNQSENLTLSDFLIGVGQLKFRGTSVLFRFSKSIMDILNFAGLGLNNDLEKNNKTLMRQDNEFKFENCKKDELYEIATHSVRIRRTGTVADISALWELEGATTPNISIDKPVFTDMNKPQFGRIESLDSFNQKTQPNEMLNGLRYYERAIKDLNTSNDLVISKEPYSWGKVDMIAMAKCLILICRSLKEIVSIENRLLRINAPCYILGDIHGNFHDLICFEKALWRMGPMLTPSCFLFLGDYVDRGHEGIEVISYMFVQKILCPNKFFILRGNHELRDIQKMYHFYDECKAKFGDELGEQVWEEVNEVFDCLPLAAIVDNKIFCIHGGIPSELIQTEAKVDDINKIICPLKNPEKESSMAWEMLWNDPLSSEFSGGNNALKENHGFSENRQRGTGFYFSHQALNEFLKKNNLSYVVRAHEVQQIGFKIQLGGRLLTVFSSSHYCGGSNEAATVLVDSNKLRLIRLDTHS